MENKRLCVVLFALGFVVLPQFALATTGGGGGLPWEAPLTTLSGSITGPVASSIALIAIAVAGGVLIWGGEINRFASMAVYIVLVLGMLVMAKNLLSGLGFTTTVIPETAITSPTTTPLPNV